MSDLVIPAWLAALLKLLPLDTREVPGAGVNPVISGLYQTLGVPAEQVDDGGDPWCAVALNAVLARSGLPHVSRFRAARALADYGDPTEPRLGSIVVLNRVDPKAPTVPHGHVGLNLLSYETAVHFCREARKPIQEHREGALWLISGNTHNQIGVGPYDPARRIAERWPSAVALAKAGLSADGLAL